MNSKTSVLFICALLPFFIFLASSWYSKAKNGLRMSLRNKKWLIIILKGFIKQPVIEQSPNFLKCFFSFLIKAFANFEKLIRFYRQVFIVYKNAENLKILIEIFCPKLLVSNVISAFLDHLKPILFSPANHGDRHRAPPLFKISGSAPSSVQDTKIAISQWIFSKRREKWSEHILNRLVWLALWSYSSKKNLRSTSATSDEYFMKNSSVICHQTEAGIQS